MSFSGSERGSCCKGGKDEDGIGALSSGCSVGIVVLDTEGLGPLMIGDGLGGVGGSVGGLVDAGG